MTNGEKSARNRPKRSLPIKRRVVPVLETKQINVLEEAKRYAAIGWPIIPDHNPTPGGGCSCENPNCDKAGKHPRLSAWTVEASTVPATLDRWGRQWPDMNISVLTGPRSNLVVLDVDPRNGGGESLSALFSPEELEALRTPIALTGGGGNHYYFKYPGSPFKTLELLPGIELKADGAKVTLPPSLHKSGNRYAWETSPFEVEPAPLPQKILEMIARKRKKERAEYGDGEPIPKGQRNCRLTAMAGALRKQGASREAIEAALMKVNETQCKEDPLEEREIMAIAKSVSRYRPEPDPAPRTFIPRILSAADLQNMVFPPPKWAVPGLIPEGLSILAGAPKAGKSFFALAVCLSVAQGGMALSSIETEAGDVLLIALEDPMPRLQRRIDSLALGEAWPERLYVMNDCPRAHEGGIAFLDGWLEEHPGTRLVVIDTFQKFRKPQGRNSNAYEVDYEAAGGLKTVADRHNVGILVLHHTKKGETIDPLEGVSGTMGISGAADTTLVLKRARGQEKADLFITGRDVEERTLALKFDDMGWKLEGDAEEVRRSDSRNAVLQAIEAAGYPMTPKEIAEYMERPRGTVRRLVSELVKGKLLTPLEGDRYITANMTNMTNRANRANRANSPDLFGGVRLE